MRVSTHFAAALALTTLGIAPAFASTSCAGGRHVADAQIVPQRNVGSVLRATQFAWDGTNRIAHVCNLTNGGGRDFTSVWNLYSREVDRQLGGICIQLTNTAGVDFYSCATAAADLAGEALARGDELGVAAGSLGMDRKSVV